MNGVLPLWKPRGMTSHDCVVKVRRIFKTKKVGHTGTLDPEVEGVLGICIGKATRVVPFLTEVDKTYIAECKLGEATETEDAHGKVIESKAVTQFPNRSELLNVLKQFTGEITQIPPMYSAVKVKGKRLYEYARANEQVERPSRQITIYDIELLDINEADKTFRFSVRCSAGTYIRTLSVDIGRALGYPAHMSFLKRTEACSFNEEDTVTLEALEEYAETETLSETLIPIAETLKHFDQIQVDEAVAKRVSHGQKLKLPEQTLHSDYFLLMHDEQLLAIYEQHPTKENEMKPYCVFI